MNSFLVGLQFLTRIHISNETVWKDEEFGKSVVFFPIYGWIIGAFMCLIYFLLKPLDMPYLTAFLIVLGELFISGGTLADGLMDSSDGLFSGRSRERSLKIMKDSPVMAREDHITDRRIININRSTEILMEENRYRIVKL